MGWKQTDTYGNHALKVLGAAIVGAVLAPVIGTVAPAAACFGVAAYLGGVIIDENFGKITNSKTQINDASVTVNGNLTNSGVSGGNINNVDHSSHRG